MTAPYAAAPVASSLNAPDLCVPIRFRARPRPGERTRHGSLRRPYPMRRATHWVRTTEATVPSSFAWPRPCAESDWHAEIRSIETGRNGGRSVRCGHAAAPFVPLSPADDARRCVAHEGRRRPDGHVRGRRNRSLSKHEAPPSGAADGHLTDGDSGAQKRRRLDGWNLCDADRAFGPPKLSTFRDCDRGPSGVDALAAQHGYAGR